MKKYFLFAAMFLAGAALFTACEEDEEGVLVAGIPADGDAEANPVVTNPNTELPNLNYTITTEQNYAVMRLDMTGVRDPFTNDWLKLYGTNNSRQNFWIEVDQQPKGFTVTNTIDEQASQSNPKVDLVFLVDNSTSMNEEADALAADIINWSKELSRTLDVRFACVGYGGFVSGAIDLTTATDLEQFLTQKDWRTDVAGVWRTRGFVGTNAQQLQDAAAGDQYRVVSSGYVYTDWSDPDADECGVVALRYANDLFSFRPGANRVYVNITDEPNQPSSKKADYSTQWVKENWQATQGTIHTVYTQRASWADTYQERIGQNYPWDLSVYTGGTMLFTNSNFQDKDGNLVKLSSLPVSGALQNSYIIRFTNIEDLFDNQSHEIHLTVKSNSQNGEVLADKRFNMVFQKNQ